MLSRVQQFWQLGCAQPSFMTYTQTHTQSLPALHATNIAVQVLYMSEADLIRCGGVDAAMYIKILRMGACSTVPRVHAVQ
jgi:hypothetical protein